MNPLQTLRVAARAVLRNKLRSFLTVLGIIIGVAAVIAMVAIGEGAKSQVVEAFASMGSNLLILIPGTTSTGGVHGGYGSLPTLTYADLKAIQTEVPSVRRAAPVLRTSASVITEDANWTTSINGTTPAYFDIRDWPAASGTHFGDAEVEGGAKVVELGQTVATHLFGGTDPVGSSVRIRGIPFRVVALLKAKGQSPVGTDYDDAVFMPSTTFATKIQGGMNQYLSGTVYIGAYSPEGCVRAQRDVTALLRDRHHLPDGADDDFMIRNLTEMAEAQAKGTETLTTLLACIAGVSLLVGGIGIMNIMLVSVTERTREIGLRMAIGATPGQILLQFLTEALVLSTSGGILGIAIGLASAIHFAKRLGWPLLIRPEIIVVSVGFSALVGIVFGLYPARTASRLDPIEALRYE